MPTIKKTKLTVGRSTGTDKEFALVSFELNFTNDEIRYNHGYYLSAYLYEINNLPDTVFQNFWGGIITTVRGSADIRDQTLGMICNERYHPKKKIEQVTRSQEWEFGSFAEGDERFKAIISIVPAVPGIFPNMVSTQEIQIDID